MADIVLLHFASTTVSGLAKRATTVFSPRLAASKQVYQKSSLWFDDVELNVVFCLTPDAPTECILFSVHSFFLFGNKCFWCNVNIMKVPFWRVLEENLGRDLIPLLINCIWSWYRRESNFLLAILYYSALQPFLLWCTLNVLMNSHTLFT